MTNEEIIKEFNALPLEARKEVGDFIAFLRQHYSKQDGHTSGDDLSKDKFVGVWKDRKDLQNRTV